jgi:hypothetical protein
MSRTKSAPGTLPNPLPATASIPFAGRVFYGAGKEKSYRLAKTGAIVTLTTGSRSKVALMHATARKLGIDPSGSGSPAA